MIGKKGGSSGGKPSLTPQRYLNPKNGYKGPFSKPNNDGNLFTRRKPTKKPGWVSPCYITEAATRARGLSDDCYELRVLRAFREEYVKALPDGEAALAEYRETAPRIVAAIEELPEEDRREVWECLYTTAIVPAVLLVASGELEEAYHLYRSACEGIGKVFLEGSPEQAEVRRWVEARLDEPAEETLRAARRVG